MKDTTDKNAELPTSDFRLTTERFVSLYGFFAFDYPLHWKNEVDEAGNYVFFDDQSGSGVLRILTLQNEHTDESAAENYLNQLLKEQELYDAKSVTIGKNRFVRFVQIHELNDTEFTVYYWATAHEDKIILFTYTVQSLMKQLPIAEKEKSEIESILHSLEFMHGQAHHG